MNILDVLMKRGYIHNVTYPEELRRLFDAGPITFYVGYDPTADSLTAGHYLTLMAMSHLQRAGHRPIALMGTGTGMIGDPSERSDMRRLMPPDEITNNISRFKVQMAKFIDFGKGRAIIDENGRWLGGLNYIDFMRSMGVHFNVSKMIAADAYKSRLESGLTLFEFNYMVLQAFDFLVLYEKYGCMLQMGGTDQWSNILAGADLIRKVHGRRVFGATLNLLTTSDGTKMGKTAKGALWLDAQKTSPYDFYQYFRNCDDGVVKKYLLQLTFLEPEEIDEITKEGGHALNAAKERLAHILTSSVHSKDAADSAMLSARALFGGENAEDMPTTKITAEQIEGGLSLLAFMQAANLTTSLSEGRRLIEGGGISIDGKKVTSHEQKITHDMLTDGAFILRKGKKVFHRALLDGHTAQS